MTKLTSTLRILAISTFTIPAVPALFSDEIPALEAPAIVAPEAQNRYTTTREMKDDTILTKLLLERLHITKKKVSDLEMDVLIENFCDTLDPSHTIFLQSDLVAMKARFAPMLFDNLDRFGNINCAFKIYEEFEKRLAERVLWTSERLKKPFDLNGSGTFKLNRKDDAFPRDIEEADEIWNQRLTNDLINELLGGNSDSDIPEEDDFGVPEDAEISENDVPEADLAPDLSESAIAAVLEKIGKRYEKLQKNLSLEPWEVEELFLNALTSQFDPHTTFFSAQSMEEFQISMRNSLCGIGALLGDVDGYCTIKEILPGGPVERSGKFSVGDRIIAVGVGDDDSASLTDVVGMRLNRIVRMLRGKKGEKIRLLVESANDHSIRKYISLERDEIKLTEQLASANVFYVPVAESGETVPVGVIELPSFYGKDRSDKFAFSTSEDVKELLQKLKKYEIQALILDLRMNGGGYLNEAIDLSELFLGKGKNVLQVKGASSSPEILKTGGKNVISLISNSLIPSNPEWTGPLVVLVSKASASASEIVAGALRDNSRAIIVGDPNTHGKGSVQEVMPFERFANGQKSSIKITRSTWYSPSGNSIQLKGVAADVPIPSVYSVLPVAESDLKNPLPWDSIKSSLPSVPETPTWLEAPISPELIEILGNASKKRQAELPEFLTLSRTISWFEAREKDKSVPLNIDERIEIQNSDKALNELVKKEYSEMQKNDFAKTEIKLDSALQKENDAAESKKLSSKKASVTPLPGTKKSAKKSGNDDDDPTYDVVLREAIRIAADWLEILKKENAAGTPSDENSEKETAPEVVSTNA